MRIAIKIRDVIDVLIALILVAVLLWCGLLAREAYIHHRNALSVNASVIDEIKKDIKDQKNWTNPDLY